MPCRYDPTPAEIAAPWKEKAESYKKKLDKLVPEADMLRELVIAFASGETPSLPKSVLNAIEKRQIEHRKADLERLEKTFIEKKDHELLKLVWAADARRPLEPQLGFDPDEY